MVIVDTSVVFKWFGEIEEKREQAKAILKNHLEKRESIVVPDLLFYELTNAWATKSHLTNEDIQENLSYLKSINLNTESINFILLNKAAQLSKKFHVSVYDATYAVLAEEKNCHLITADVKFSNKLNLPFVKILT